MRGSHLRQLLTQIDGGSIPESADHARAMACPNGGIDVVHFPRGIATAADAELESSTDLPEVVEKGEDGEPGEGHIVQTLTSSRPVEPVSQNRLNRRIIR